MKTKANTGKLYLLMFILSIVWGLSFIFAKFALEDLNTVEVLAVRWPMAAILFTLLVLFKVVKVDYKSKSKSDIRTLLLLVLCQPCLYAILEIVGLDYTTSSESSVIIAMIPLTVVVNSSIIFKEKVASKTKLGILIAFAGVICCIVFSPGFSIGGKGIGYLCLIGAVICGSFYSILGAKLGSKFTPMEITYAMTVGGGVWFFIWSLLAGNCMHPYKVLFAGGMCTWSLIYLGILCSFMAYLIYNISLANLSAALATCIISNSINVVGVIAGIIITKDPWGIYTVLGLLLIVFGIVVANLEDLKKKS